MIGQAPDESVTPIADTSNMTKHWDARALPVDDETIQSIVTSPPYWGQRDYGYPEQIGIEPVYTDYLDEMMKCLAEMRRVLRPDGTLWLNIGDTFNTRAPIRGSSHQGGLGHDNASIRRTWAENRDLGLVRYSARQPGLKDKDLMGIPWRLAIRAVEEQGWYLRCDVIWSKPFGAPEKVKDRPRRMHEYVFLFSKSRTYYCNRGSLTSVWDIAPASDPTHSAVFPDELVRLCLEATTRPGDTVLDPFAGSGTTGRVAEKMGRKYVGGDLHPKNRDDPEEGAA